MLWTSRHWLNEYPAVWERFFFYTTSFLFLLSRYRVYVLNNTVGVCLYAWIWKYIAYMRTCRAYLIFHQQFMCKIDISFSFNVSSLRSHACFCLSTQWYLVFPLSTYFGIYRLYLCTTAFWYLYLYLKVLGSFFSL